MEYYFYIGITIDIFVLISKFFHRFACSLEKACITTIEEGKMTKDLAVCVHGTQNVTEGTYLNTHDFLLTVENKLQNLMKQKWLEWLGTSEEGSCQLCFHFLYTTFSQALAKRRAAISLQFSIILL